MHFGTKAETLVFLYSKKEDLGACILKPYFFTVDAWKKNRNSITREILAELENCPRLIVRSSALAEDSEEASMAGKYESLICDATTEALGQAVDAVIASYGAENIPQNQVLVQQAVENVTCSGVAFTVDPNSGGRYYVINYDDKTGTTDSVTSGMGTQTELMYCFSAGDEQEQALSWLSKLLHTLHCLEHLSERQELDIEFLFSDGVLYLLQVRPLCMRMPVVAADFQKENLQRIATKIRQQNAPKLFLHGNRTIYGVMPDWNPAEMIGIHPKNLAMSFYREIITDEVWAYQRDNYGYMKLRSFPLMQDFCGYPYIDVRVSFNSFIPSDLNVDIAEKLVNYYLDRLEEHPDSHDKVEFDIVFSCYTLDLPKRLQVLLSYGFSQSEIDSIRCSLLNLTNRISNSRNGLWKQDAEKIEILSERYMQIAESNMSDVERMYWLLEDCKRYGTLPFAGLARAGFIAVQMLKSMVTENILSQEDYEAFLGDLETVSFEMQTDLQEMDKENFLKKYGFLRPGTYDICSFRYDEAPDIYFDWSHKESTDERRNSKKQFKLTLEQMQHIKDALSSHGLNDDVLGLFSFIRAAIEGRERAKFIFTRNVSEILRLFGIYGERLGFAREELAYADVSLIKELYTGVQEEKQVLAHLIEAGKKKYLEGLGIVLPPLLVREQDVWCFKMPKSRPTFLTGKRTEGVVRKIEDVLEQGMEGVILLIPAADPGYDWIFSHKIRGFVTAFGGANSHMAIRAGELGIPAAVGVGTKLFETLSEASRIEIDASLQQIRVLR